MRRASLLIHSSICWEGKRQENSSRILPFRRFLFYMTNEIKPEFRPEASSFPPIYQEKRRTFFPTACTTLAFPIFFFFFQVVLFSRCTLYICKLFAYRSVDRCFQKLRPLNNLLSSVRYVVLLHMQSRHRRPVPSNQPCTRADDATGVTCQVQQSETLIAITIFLVRAPTAEEEEEGGEEEGGKLSKLFLTSFNSTNKHKFVDFSYCEIFH